MLDPGLTPNELAAIRRALLIETNPSHLIGFASCLSPYFPVAASFLYARSQFLELREQTCQRDLATDGRAALESLRALIDRESRGVWSGARGAEWILCPIDTAENLAHATMRATKGAWPDVAEAWREVSPPVVQWPRLERMRAAAVGLAAIRSGDPRIQQMGRALCQPTRPDRSLAATLQAAGFHEHFSLTCGGSACATRASNMSGAQAQPELGKRTDDFIHAGTRAMRNGTDVRSELLARRRSELAHATPSLTPDLRHEAATLAGQLVIDPSASSEGVPMPAAVLARAATLEVGPGIWIVDARFHGPDAKPIARRTDWATLAADRARWIDWHVRAARAG